MEEFATHNIFELMEELLGQLKRRHFTVFTELHLLVLVVWRQCFGIYSKTVPVETVTQGNT